VDPHGADQRPHVPPPSLWPVGFAVGIAVLLTGLIVGWHIVALGAILTVVFAFLWVRDATADMRGADVVQVEPERREVAAASAPRADEGEWGAPPAGDADVDRFPRSRFLEGATLGIGGVIGGIVTLPVLGFTVLPAFVDQGREEVDVGPVDDFPEGKFVITTFLAAPAEGEVSRRTAYVRNNGERDGLPSFTIVSNRCVHLGCPTQPNGLPEENAKKEEMTKTSLVTRIPVTPAGFGCPCHGGQYDTEGNRTAGPPVRALDRYEFSIRDGRLWLGKTFSVSKVQGEGKNALIHKYAVNYPGVHVDGPEQFFYPITPPR
jgi:Rieske Fe-S protein